MTAAEVEQLEELIPWAAGATPAMFAGLAPAVATSAEGGDLRANALLSLAAEELALHIRTLARRLFGDEQAAAPVAFAGGLLTRGTLLRKRLEHGSSRRYRSSAPRGGRDPGTGAVRGALRFLGVIAS